MLTYLRTDQRQTDQKEDLSIASVQPTNCININIVQPSTIAIAPTSSSVQIGNTQQLTAVCTDQSGIIDCPVLAWSSSDDSIATVDQSGLVTGITTGSTNITAGASGVTSNISAVTVTLPPPVLTTITIYPASASIQIGNTQQLTAVCTDQNGIIDCPALTWSSTSSLIATVSDSGLVKGLSEGSSSITAMASEVISDVSVIMVTIPPPAEAGMVGILVVGLAVGALLTSQKTKKMSIQV